MPIRSWSAALRRVGHDGGLRDGRMPPTAGPGPAIQTIGRRSHGSSTSSNLSLGRVPFNAGSQPCSSETSRSKCALPVFQALEQDPRSRGQRWIAFKTRSALERDVAMWGSHGRRLTRTESSHYCLPEFIAPTASVSRGSMTALPIPGVTGPRKWVFWLMAGQPRGLNLQVGRTAGLVSGNLKPAE